jgi:hypothetical protein
MWRKRGAGISPKIEREASYRMKLENRSDVAGEESGDDLDLCVGQGMETIDDSDLGSLNRLCERDELVHEADPVGGWIVETQERSRNELDLFDPDAPSIERIARSYRLQRMSHLLLF